MTRKVDIPNQLILLIALLQGLGLYLLHDAVEFKHWPFGQDQWLYLFYSLLLTVPTLLLLGLENGKITPFLKYTGGFALLIALLSYYTGLQTTSHYYLYTASILAPCIPAFGVATLKTLIYSQSMITHGKLEYSELFRQSWRSVCTLALSILFMLIVWGILILWGALFNAIDIKFFKELFDKTWFIYPTLALAHGVGITLFRHHASIIDTIVGLVQVLLKYVLIILAFVTLIFLVTLPITGLTPLWKSGGSNLIIGMQLMLLFFVNAVYQDDSNKQTYSTWLHGLITISLLIMPLYSLISLYGLTIRVAQYGFSVDRCWALLLWLVLFLFSASYAVAVIRHRSDWLPLFKRINIRLGLVVMLLAFLVNSPVLDFRKITVSSQLARLENKQVTIEEFDFNYFARELGTPGSDALDQLVADYQQVYPQIAVRVEAIKNQRSQQEISLEKIISGIEVLNADVPANLYPAIAEFANKNRWQLGKISHQYVFELDMDNNAQADYLYIWQRSDYLTFTLFYRDNNQWQHRTVSSFNLQKDHTEQATDIIKKLKNGDFRLQPKRWQQLVIDGKTLNPSE